MLPHLKSFILDWFKSLREVTIHMGRSWRRNTSLYKMRVTGAFRRHCRPGRSRPPPPPSSRNYASRNSASRNSPPPRTGTAKSTKCWSLRSFLRPFWRPFWGPSWSSACPPFGAKDLSTTTCCWNCCCRSRRRQRPYSSFRCCCCCLSLWRRHRRYSPRRRRPRLNVSW